MKNDPPARTLYRAALADPRERAAQPRELIRGRAARRVEETSDVRRFRGVIAATLAGAAAATAAALLLPPPGGHSSPGPLSRPHARAGLECAACHSDGANAKKAPPGQACAGCHGQHGSTRAGHGKMLETGAMTCATCHPIHRGDQGVVLRPEGPPIRFAPGAETEVAPTAFRPAREATVALVTAGACAGCHDIASPRDPIARCLPRGLERLGGARPIACFDEHQVALPEDGRGISGARRSARPGASVCSAQHADDRALAWEAAREIAAAVPIVPGAAAAVPAQALAWLGAGLGAAGLVLASARGGRRLLSRRRRQAAPPPEALVRPATRVRLPQIDTSTCLGCYACVDACPYDVLAMDRYVAVVARPEACCGLTLCEQRCPNGSLKITDGEPIGDRPRLGDDLQSPDVPGLYLAGDITGLPLIKNAIHQGAHAASRVAEDLKAAPGRGRSSDEAPLDLMVVGAGPAGISAALRAKELGLTFEVIEQGSVAQSIRSFPRGKLVFDQPLDLPVAGKLWLRESTKEELLGQWLRVVRQEKLPIREDTRMVSVAHAPGGDGFVVTTEPREGGARTERRARRLLLAIGQRGSPRRLPFPLLPAIEDRVYYHLADARSLAGQRVLIVGLGDVAMEAAIALARQPGTEVTIAYRGGGFRRGQARNIEEVRRMAAASRLSLRFETEVTGLARDGRGGGVVATLSAPAGARQLTVDAVLVLIGSIPPWSTLRAVGIQSVAEADGGDRSPPADVKEGTAASDAP
jgi:thioredoxin reductase